MTYPLLFTPFAFPDCRVTATDGLTRPTPLPSIIPVSGERQSALAPFTPHFLLVISSDDGSWCRKVGR
jgi:hypothetical protein